MATEKNTTCGPLTKSDVLDRVDLARRLVALSSEQARQAQTNADLARLGLAELLVDLEHLGVTNV